jgi:hypothetical protein
VVSFTLRPLYTQGKSPWYPLDRRLVGRRAVLDAVVKRKIPNPRRESNPRTPILQSVAQRYTDRDITTFVRVKILRQFGHELQAYLETTIRIHLNSVSRKTKKARQGNRSKLRTRKRMITEM